MNASQHNNKPACIRIFRDKPLTQRMPTRTGTPVIPRHPSQEAPALSVTTFRSHHLMQQLLQISHQELTDLQTCLGGEKTLKDLLNNFFHKRQQRQEANRSVRNHNFKPMKNIFCRRYEQEEREEREER